MREIQVVQNWLCGVTTANRSLVFRRRKQGINSELDSIVLPDFSPLRKKLRNYIGLRKYLQIQ